MSTKSNPLARHRVRGHSPPPSDNLERGRRGFGDAKDIARDERRHLPQYDADSEEITANHHINVTVNVPQPSQADIEPESLRELGALGKRVPKRHRKLVAWLVSAGVAIIAIAAQVQSCRK